MLMMGACIVGYILRETLEDLQKKKADHDCPRDQLDNPQD